MAERISFTRPSAERIARAVRVVENARPDAMALRSRRIADFAKTRTIRMGTYTGAWSIGVPKTVTFKYRTQTPNTASVQNLFFPVLCTQPGERDCAIAKDGTSWFLIDVQFYTATAVFITQTAQQTFVSNIQVGATFNSSSCTVNVGRTLTTATAVFATVTASSSFVRLCP